MDFIVKDRNVQPIAVIDLYASAIWTERYSDTGDFTLIMPVNSEYLDYLAIDNYLTLPGSDRAMIIEAMELVSEVSTGKKVVSYTGTSLESILKRRIVWSQTTITGDLIAIIRQLLNENLIFPEESQAGRNSRKISDFIFPEVTDSVMLALVSAIGTIKCQFTGDTLFDAIKDLCDPYNIGFKVCFNDAGQFVFSLYYGTDRSSNQSERDPVVFSPEYDTLISSRYVANFTDYKNVTLVLGEDAGANRKRAIVYSGSSEPRGLDRRELYTDARDLQSERENGTTMTDAEYTQVLQNRGYSKLNEHSISAAFDGEVETSIGPQFNRDYFLGDFVSAINEYGLGSIAQITEYVRSYDENGYSAYPTFVMVS